MPDFKDFFQVSIQTGDADSYVMRFDDMWNMWGYRLTEETCKEALRDNLLRKPNKKVRISCLRQPIIHFTLEKV